MNIAHPDGNGRQQPDSDAYTILSAKIANERGDTVSVLTKEAGAMHISAADTPALFEKFLAWTQSPGNSADAYAAPPPPEPSELDTLKTALIAKGTITEADIEAAKTAEVSIKKG